MYLLTSLMWSNLHNTSAAAETPILLDKSVCVQTKIKKQKQN